MISRRRVLAGSASLALLGACAKRRAPPVPDPNRTKELLAKLESWRKKQQRSAWRPVLGSAEGELTGSRIGGTPWLSTTGEEWPSCGSCKNPLQFFLQLQTATLPPETKG